jgi:hypothetical protein
MAAENQSFNAPEAAVNSAGQNLQGPVRPLATAQPLNATPPNGHPIEPESLDEISLICTVPTGDFTYTAAHAAPVEGPEGAPLTGSIQGLKRLAEHFTPLKPRTGPPRDERSALLRQALQLAKQAHALKPCQAVISALEAATTVTFSGASGVLHLEEPTDLQRIEAKIDQLLDRSEPSRPAPPPPPPLPRTYAAAAASGNKALNQGPKPRTRPGPTPGPTPNPTNPTTARITLILSPSTPSTQRPGIGPGRRVPFPEARALRDALNNRLGGVLAAAIERSRRGNLVITLMPNVPAAEVLAKEPEWASVFRAFPVLRTEESRPWLQLVAHGVPMRDFTGSEAADLAAELKTFNPYLLFAGTPRWLTRPDIGKQAGSIIFSVYTEEAKESALKYGIRVGGITASVEALRAFSATTQCRRCQGYSHDPLKCRARACCRLCAGPHLTKDHKCITCAASGLCQHVIVCCGNCRGSHQANSTMCEVFRALKPLRAPQAPGLQQPSGPDRAPTVGPAPTAGPEPETPRNRTYLPDSVPQSPTRSGSKARNSVTDSEFPISTAEINALMTDDF